MRKCRKWCNRIPSDNTLGRNYPSVGYGLSPKFERVYSRRIQKFLAESIFVGNTIQLLDNLMIGLRLYDWLKAKLRDWMKTYHFISCRSAAMVFICNTYDYIHFDQLKCLITHVNTYDLFSREITIGNHY